MKKKIVIAAALICFAVGAALAGQEKMLALYYRPGANKHFDCTGASMLCSDKVGSEFGYTVPYSSGLQGPSTLRNLTVIYTEP